MAKMKMYACSDAQRRSNRTLLVHAHVLWSDSANDFFLISLLGEKRHAMISLLNFSNVAIDRVKKNERLCVYDVPLYKYFLNMELHIVKK